MVKYDEYGREVLDDTPVEVPLRLRNARPPSIQELIAMHVRAQAQVEKAMGVDDEENFDEDEEMDDVLTPYEMHAYAAEADQEIRSAEIADKLVRSQREKRARRGAGKAAEKQAEAGGAGGAGEQAASAGETGREVAGDDRGGKEGAK